MIDALHLVYKNKIASEEAIKSFRKFNPDSVYVVIGDAGDDYYDICKKYDCVYLHSPFKCGYPEMPHGFRHKQMQEYLKRMFIASNICSSSHVMIMEDDVHIINDIQVNPDVGMYVGNTCLMNIINPIILNFIREKSQKQTDSYYGMGGGAIFNRQIFIDSYNLYNQTIMNNFDEMQSIYPTIGWSDCIMSIFMMMGGASHKHYERHHELGRHGQSHEGRNYDGIEEKLKDKYSILHHYKKYY